MYAWSIETSHLVAVPRQYTAIDLEDLKRQLQETADSKRLRVDRPPIGPLAFKVEYDEAGELSVVHSSFQGRNGKRLRFMRLRRVA